MVQRPGVATDSAIILLAERARLFGERIPQEKVYVQMDNTGYFLGDTIWFAAHTRRTDTGRPSRVSRMLYAELWNHDGFLVERKLVEMREGRGHGFFALPDTLYAGYFELRAYTRWQLNWGQTEHPHNKNTELWFYNKEMAKDYFQDYEKLYSRVFPVYDKPRQEGEYVQEMTLRPLRRYFRSEKDKPRPMLSLFPEGGSLLYNYPCNMAFEVATTEGEELTGSVCLLSGRDTIASAHTEHRGRGTLSFTPESGRTYKVVFTDGEGNTVEQKVGEIEEEGVSLHAEREDSMWMITLLTNLRCPLGLTVMHEGVTVSFREIKDEETTLRFAREELPTGVNQVTVFDGEGRVWADRLFFVTKPETYQPTVRIEGMKKEYAPFERAELSVRAPQAPFSTVSVAVRDGVRSPLTYDTGNIMTEMLLSSEIRGFVPKPEWFFEKDDPEHQRGLDLLLMTQGWRRFRWQDMAVGGRWDITHPAEQTQVLTGSVHPYFIDYPDQSYGEKKKAPPSYLELLNLKKTGQMGGLPQGNSFRAERTDYRVFSAGSPVDIMGEEDLNALIRRLNTTNSTHIGQGKYAENKFEYLGNLRLKRDVRVHAEFVRPNPKAGVVGDVTTVGGNFRLEVPRFYGDCLLFLTAKDTTLWNKKIRKFWTKQYRTHNWVQVEDGIERRMHEDAEFYVRLRFPYPRWTKPYNFYQCKTDSLREEDPWTESGVSARVMNTVTARARRNGLRRLDLSKPVYVMDAYEAGNEAMDAGLLTDLYAFKHKADTNMLYSALGYQNTHEIAEACIQNHFGDMGMDRRYHTTLLWDSVRVAGEGVWALPIVDKEIQRQYSRLEHIDKIYFYSDYSPRWEGSQRYSQDDQPTVEVSLHKLPGNQRRLTYRDRRYILHGFANQADFYNPDYHRSPPHEGQQDYRRTLYWNPELRLDKEGKATVTFFTGSRPQTHLQMEVEGQSSDGFFLYNKP